MILLYHKVFLESPTPWWVNSNQFWRQMAELAHRTVVYLDDYDPNNPDQVVITFDGVYENVYQYALPILKSFGYPFELFVVGDTIGQDNTFDQAVEPPARFADRETLAKLIQGGGRLQWHSKTHSDLVKEGDPDKQLKELQVPDELRALDPEGFGWFGYPYGNHDDALIELTRKHFNGALSCVNGNNHDPFQFNRIIAVNDTSFKTSTVSLIIANYNYGSFAAEAIESALAQSIHPDEILFMDDCSTDNSMDIAQRYKDRIRIVRNEENLGIIGNFNKAVSLTTGDYICFLDADNRFRSDYVQRCRLALDRHPKAAIAYTNTVLFGPRAELIASQVGAKPVPNVDDMYLWEFPEFDRAHLDKLKTANFMHGSSMYRRKAFEQVGGYGESEGHEDHDLFVRMVTAGWDAVLVPEFVLEYRHHSGEQTGSRVSTEMELVHTRRMVKERDKRLEAYNLVVEDRLGHYLKLEKTMEAIRNKMAKGDSAGAIELTEDTLQQFVEQAHLLRLYAQNLLYRDDTPGAVLVLQCALLYSPDFAAAHNDLGSLYYEQGKMSDAVHHLEQATKFKPDDSTSLKNLAELYEETGRINDSLLTYKKIIRHHPQDLEALIALGKICQKMERVNDAGFFFERALDIDPGSSIVKENLKNLHA